MKHFFVIFGFSFLVCLMVLSTVGDPMCENGSYFLGVGDAFKVITFIIVFFVSGYFIGANSDF